MFIRDINFKQKTKKQEVETVIKDALLDLAIERNEAFKDAVRAKDTSIMVSKKYNKTINICSKDGNVKSTNDNNKIYVPETIFDDIENEYEDKVMYIKNMLKPMLANMLPSNKVNPNMYESTYEKDTELSKYVEMDEEFNKKYTFNMECIYADSDKSNEDSKTEQNENDDNGEREDESQTPQTQDNLIYDFQDNDIEDNDKVQEEEKTLTHWLNNKSCLSDSDIKECKMLANKIIQSFKGRDGKDSTIVPTKRINSKAINQEHTEKIYITKFSNSGKNLGKVNIIIDTSGSMSGFPIKNAIKLSMIFNQIARDSYCNGNIIFSQTDKRTIIKMPVEDKVLVRASRVNNAEGIAATIESYKDELAFANNICVTDGDICDRQINLSKYKNIEIIGVYVTDSPEPESFNGSLSRWFNKSLVRPDISSLVQKIIHLKLRSKK